MSKPKVEIKLDASAFERIGESMRNLGVSAERMTSALANIGRAMCRDLAAAPISSTGALRRSIDRELYRADLRKAAAEMAAQIDADVEQVVIDSFRPHQRTMIETTSFGDAEPSYVVGVRTSDRTTITVGEIRGEQPNIKKKEPPLVVPGVRSVVLPEE